MPERLNVIVELDKPQKRSFERYSLNIASESDRTSAAESLMNALVGYDCELHKESIPIPMVSGPVTTADESWRRLSKFASDEVSPDIASATTAIEVSIPKDRIARLRKKSGVIVWPSSPMTYLAARKPIQATPDCDYQLIASMHEIRELLRIDALWAAKLNGRGVVVAVVDDGIHQAAYPIGGGYDGPASQPPGLAPMRSHGSMCAADILLSAPNVTLLDYPMLTAESGEGLRMYQHILNLKRMTGKPHLTNNSYGFVGVPPKARYPRHEIHDLNHPFHRKVREVAAAGVGCFFAAGNCGEDCPSAACDISGVGPGRSIHATNSIEEVITVAAVNKVGKRLGYSAQGPGMFAARKPDIASYSHFYAHLGPKRPAGGGAKSFDSGTSAATPLAVGVAALLMQAFPKTTPAQLKAALLTSAWRSGASSGWNRDYGYGIIDAFSAWTYLRDGIAAS